MLHEPAAAKQERDHASAHKARYGLWLFWAYCAIYVGFVAINLLRPEWMEARTLLGMNLAVFYGFGLIVLAIVLGLVYNAKCSRLEDRMNTSGRAEGDQP